MKKNIFLTSSILIILFFNCKEEKKVILNEEINSEELLDSSLLKTYENPKTVFEYIEGGDKEKYGVDVFQSLDNLIDVQQVSLFRELKSDKVFIVIKLKQELNDSLKEKYRLIVRSYPLSIDELRPETLKLERDFDTWYSDLNSYSDGIYNYVYASIGKSGYFKRLRLQLLDKETRKFTRQPIEIEDIEAME